MYTFISLALFLGIAEVYSRCHVNLRPGWRKQLFLRALALSAGLVCGVAAVDLLLYQEYSTSTWALVSQLAGLVLVLGACALIVPSIVFPFRAFDKHMRVVFKLKSDDRS